MMQDTEGSCQSLPLVLSSEQTVYFMAITFKSCYGTVDTCFSAVALAGTRGHSSVTSLFCLVNHTCVHLSNYLTFLLFRLVRYDKLVSPSRPARSAQLETL